MLQKTVRSIQMHLHDFFEGLAVSVPSELEHVGKDGYIPSPRIPRTFELSAGSAESPVIFRMWRKVTGEKIVTGRKVSGIDGDGRFYTLDLVKRTKR